MRLSCAAATALLLVAATGALFAEAAGGVPAGPALGVVLGEPTGITLRWGLGGNQSLEGKAAWSFAESSSGGTRFTFQANYLMEIPGILVIQKENFPLYVGLGAQTQVGDAFSLALRFPCGVLYRFASAPVELFLELGLGMQLYPATQFVGSGCIGFRYFFKPARGSATASSNRAAP